MISNRKAVISNQRTLFKSQIHMHVTNKGKRSHEFEKQEEGYMEEFEIKERKGRHAVIIIMLSPKKTIYENCSTCHLLYFLGKNTLFLIKE